MPKSRLYITGFATLLGFPLLGALILWLVEDDPMSFVFNWTEPYNVGIQLIVGTIYGLIAGFFAWWFINRPKYVSIKKKYGHLIFNLRLGIPAIIFLSFCAGVGEEFLFRGVIQPYWGVEITAIFFVAIHGYLDPRDRNMFVYGALMSLMIVGVGYMNNYFGLIAAMTAHMMIDVVLFYQLSNDDSLAPKPFIQEDLDHFEIPIDPFEPEGVPLPKPWETEHKSDINPQ